MNIILNVKSSIKQCNYFGLIFLTRKQILNSKDLEPNICEIISTFDTSENLNKMVINAEGDWMKFTLMYLMFVNPTAKPIEVSQVIQKYEYFLINNKNRKYLNPEQKDYTYFLMLCAKLKNVFDFIVNLR